MPPEKLSQLGDFQGCVLWYLLGVLKSSPERQARAVIVYLSLEITISDEITPKGRGGEDWPLLNLGV